MHPDHGETKKEFAHEVAIADGIDAVFTDARKAEIACDTFAIENDGGPSEGAGTKRENIGTNQAITDAFFVTFKSFDLAEQVMRKSDRLSALQMRVTGHENIDVSFGEIEQRGLQSAKLDSYLATLLFH